MHHRKSSKATFDFLHNFADFSVEAVQFVEFASEVVHFDRRTDVARLWLLLLDGLNGCKKHFQCFYDESNLAGLEGSEYDADEVVCIG